MKVNTKSKKELNKTSTENKNKNLEPNKTKSENILSKYPEEYLKICPIYDICNKIIPPEVKEEYIRKINNRQNLNNAVNSGEIHLEYQPIVDSVTQEIIYVESLARWTNKRKKIPPSFFIPIAEETLIINTIGRQILIESCRQNKEWQDKGFKKVHISVNVSYAQLYNGVIAKDIEEALQISGLSPEWLKIELTETGVIPKIEGFRETLDRIKDRGVEIFIDDFGTEFSSLSHLRSIRVDGLKIDKSFIDNIDDPNDIYSKNIVKSMIDIANSLNMKMVAEGIERKSQMEILKSMGCTSIQGYLYSKPLSTAKIAKLLEKGKIEI